MADYFQILSVIVAVFLAVYYYLTSTFDFWKDRGVVGPRPIPGFGNIKDVMLRKISIGDYIARLYEKYKNEPMIGIFVRGSPSLILCDLDLIKDVLIKDFSTFDNRGLNVLERTDALATNLFNVEARRWRPLRTKLSPVFTSGKLREMFPLILECAENLEQCLEKVIEKGGFMDCREITARFSTDVIGSCVFGINMNALSDEESEFRRIGRKIFDQNLKTILRITFRDTFPRLYNFLWFLIPQSEVSTFIIKLVADTMKYREENNIVRPDFINMLMELKKHPEKIADIELTDTILAAQAFVFFAAGFETSSTTISHALYEMALNPDIQDKLRREIIEFHVKTNGNLKYEQVKEMKYLDKIFKETLRKYSAGTLLRRRSNANYTFSGTKVTIPKGTGVFIPVYAIQRDSNIYPDPEKFDPERFNEDAVAARHPMSYLPFGDGPRNCIGARFAIYQTKMGLIKILHKFKVDVCEKTITTYVHNPNSLTLSPKGGIHLKISKVES
ncbi:putative cytochrome P450 6a13 [Bombus vancouverensis nearcticus]|uniref:putative cytochrome P450 6a13 n=1 Tax=Bombus vancouverensis nearcticus TaxID=2705178 RepID=UPI00402B15FA